MGMGSGRYPIISPSGKITYSLLFPYLSRFFEIPIQGHTCHIYAAHPMISQKKPHKGANNNDNLNTLIAPPSNNNYKTTNNYISTKPSAKQKKSKKNQNTPFLLVNPIHAVHMFSHCSIINRQDKAYQLRGYRSRWPRCHA